MNSQFALMVIIKTTIVLVAAASIAFSLRRAAASIRHVVWTAALVAVLLLPLLAVQLPMIELRVLPAAPTARAAMSPAIPTSNPTFRSDSVATPAPPSPQMVRWSAARILFFVWLSGAAAMAFRSIIGFFMIRRILLQATVELPAAHQPTFKKLMQTFGVRGVSVRLSDRSITPMTAGLRTSTILLPAEADTWPEERLRFVLAHELAHVKRRDTLLQIPIQIACSLHWFNPLVWMAHRRFLIERERACDDFVINFGAQPDAYAGHLLDIARSVRHKPRFAFSGIFMANRSQLETRLLSILDKNMNRKSPNSIVLVFTVITVVAVLIPFATVQLRAQESKQIESKQSAPAAVQEKRERMMLERQKKAYLDAQQNHDVDQDSERAAIERALENYHQALKEWQSQRGEFDINAAELGRQDEAMKDRIRELEHEFSMNLENGSKERRAYDAYFHSLQSRNAEHVDKAVGPLTDALQDSNSEVRGAAARALGELRDPRAVAPLLKAMSDESAEVRQHAATALGEIRDTTAAGALIQAVKDPNSSVREHAIRALANMRSTDALSAILEAMKDADPAVRKAAVEGLAEIVKQ